MTHILVEAVLHLQRFVVPTVSRAQTLVQHRSRVSCDWWTLILELVSALTLYWIRVDFDCCFEIQLHQLSLVWFQCRQHRRFLQLSVYVGWRRVQLHIDNQGISIACVGVVDALIVGHLVRHWLQKSRSQPRVRRAERRGVATSQSER